MPTLESVLQAVGLERVLHTVEHTAAVRIQQPRSKRIRELVTERRHQVVLEQQAVGGRRHVTSPNDNVTHLCLRVVQQE